MKRFYDSARDSRRLKDAGLWPEFRRLKGKWITHRGGTEIAFLEILPELVRLEGRELTPDELAATRSVPDDANSHDRLAVALASKGNGTPAVNLAWVMDAIGRIQGGEKVDLLEAPSIRAVAILRLAEGP